MAQLCQWLQIQSVENYSVEKTLCSTVRGQIIGLHQAKKTTKDIT